MLPATFDNDPLLRVGKSVIGIFAVALLTAGFSLTALLCFAIRNPIFQADAIFMPSLSSSILGLLTIFYGFLISSRFSWNTPALLVTIAAALSTLIYASLLLWTHRKLRSIRSHQTITQPVHVRAASIASDNNTPYQAPSYYENYVRNMYPASAHQTQAAGGYEDPNPIISEEEMQRQQMLMLLLQRDQQPSPDPSSDTFRLDWQVSQEQETPVQGYYAPGSGSASASASYPNTAYPTFSPQVRPPGLVRQLTQEGLRPWDGVWRGVAARRVPEGQDWALSQDEREVRRRQIEMGLR